MSDRLVALREPGDHVEALADVIDVQHLLPRSRYPDILTIVAKILVSIDDRLLARVDKEAKARGLSRSAYLALLATQDLGIEVGPGRSATVRSALRRIDRLCRKHQFGGNVTAAIRGERDSR